MNTGDYSNYIKLYESRLAQCEFLSEQNLTADDIIRPLEDLITEEFLNKLLQKGKEAIGKFGKTVSNVTKNVGQAIGNFFTGIVNFFKNFSLKKLASSIFSKIKEIGAKVWNKVKEYLSGFSQFILANNLVNENNTPNFKNIWTVLCAKAKSVVNFKEAGVDDAKLQSVGTKVQINEADKYDISDEEVKYYGVFEKIAHALGIKNARFNGVVSQIMKKGTIGLIIIGLIKASGLVIGGLSLGLSPVGMAVIGGMLLMAGLIILAIWVCKPYPTIEDCLSYLHIAFGGNLGKVEMVDIFTIDPQVSEPQKPIAGGIEDIEKVEEVKPLKSMYPVMIKNLKSLQSMIISFDGVKLEGEAEPKTPTKTSGRPGQKTRIKEREKVKEGFQLLRYDELLLEKEFSKQSRNVTITKAEDYLTQAFKNIQKSLKVLKDEKDKGIGVTSKFVGDILEGKMKSKDVIKELYTEIYEHLYGKYSKTIPDFGPLYKESIEIISDERQRKVVAEKIARLAKRTMQFEGENMYGGMGEFGADMEEFNTTLKEIMASVKADIEK